MSEMRLKNIADEVAKQHPEMSKEMIETVSFAMMMLLMTR